MLLTGGPPAGGRYSQSDSGYQPHPNNPEQRSLTSAVHRTRWYLRRSCFGDIDKPRAEVVIEIVVEVSRGRTPDSGHNPPTSVTVTLAADRREPLATRADQFTLNSFTFADRGDFPVIDSGRILLAAGDRQQYKGHSAAINTRARQRKGNLENWRPLPIATGSFQSGSDGSSTHNSNILDVGVNVDIAPYIHANNEVTLKMSLEISSVAGDQNIDGFNRTNDRAAANRT